MPNGYAEGGRGKLRTQALGNKNNTKSRPWKNAIRKALLQFEEGDVRRGDALRKIADKLVRTALDPSHESYQFAVRELGLRLDGKPTETVEIGDSTQEFIGISKAFSLLAEFAGRSEVIDGEIVVPDRPLLSVEVCVEAGGCGEGVDISEDTGGPGEP